MLMFVKRPYLVNPSVSVLVEHGEGDLEPGQRLNQDRQQEEVLAAIRNRTKYISKFNCLSKVGILNVGDLTCTK